MSTARPQGTVVAVCRNPQPGLPKPVVAAINLIADMGVEGDYHAGRFVRHRYLARKDPTAPNLRQVLLVDTSVFADLASRAIHIGPGMMGENITLSGIVVRELTIGTRLQIASALLEVTEVRDPCQQLNAINPQLLKNVVLKEHGLKHSNAGIMARVLQGGQVHTGDTITRLD